MMKGILKTVFIPLAAVAAAACDGGPTGPGETAAPGSLGFSYEGAVNGRFDAAGAPLLDAGGRAAFGDWAVAGASPRFPDQKLAVVGFRGQSQGEGVLFAITVPRVAPGTTVAIDRNCAEPGCASALLLFGSNPRRPHDGVEQTCEIFKGTLTVVSLSESRVTGTFSGQGYCVADVHTDPFLPFTVTGGSFDAAVTQTFRSGVNVL
jgi:hypothetical protein